MWISIESSRCDLGLMSSVDVFHRYIVTLLPNYAGARSLNAFVAHAVFPNHSWRNFLHGAERGIFEKFWITNSQPTITNQLPENDVFDVLDLLPQIVHDLDTF